MIQDKITLVDSPGMMDGRNRKELGIREYIHCNSTFDSESTLRHSYTLPSISSSPFSPHHRIKRPAR